MRNKKSSLDTLQKKIDSRKEVPGMRRSELRTRAGGAPGQWKTSEKKKAKKVRRISWVGLVFALSVVFFIGAATFTGFLFFSGTNTVSTRNVDIAISGPTEVRAGDVLALQVVVTNRNSVPMELTDLVVEFPSGTRSETDLSTSLPRIRESLGTINAGESVNRTVRAVVFGQADTEIEIHASVEYRVPDSNAIFISEESYALPISQSPASIDVESLNEVISGQETPLSVTVTSNVTGILKDLLLVADYPPGFSFVSSSPEPAFGTNVWRVGDLPSSSERAITIRGIFTGEDTDERVVHFTVGAQSDTDQSEVSAPLATNDVTVTLAKPFVSLALSLDGDVATEHVASRGKVVRGDIRWTNNLPQRVQDVEVEVKLDGQVLDRSSVTADRGFWRSTDNTIVWSRESDPVLGDVEPGASGILSFSFTPRDADDGTYRNPEINLNATVRARRISETNVPEVLESGTEARVLVQTDLMLESAVAHMSGPIPPQADTETIYTISWTVQNSSNDLANASVSAILPSYVRFVDSLSGNAVSYNPIGGAVTWNIGDMDASTSQSASFQIALTPSLSQVNRLPTLVSDQRVFGFDRFIRAQIERTAPAITTGTGVPNQQGTVVAP
ncbi:MAG: hypothetical protein ACJKTH_00550 [Patescibacteria group bacterium UBA2163]